MKIHADGLTYSEIYQEFAPTRIIKTNSIANFEELSRVKFSSISFQVVNCATWQGSGSFVLLDFGKELCGGIRIITREVTGIAKFRLTFGESVSEACSSIGGFGNPTNDHSPRDFEVVVPMMSDLTFGQTGFRFVRVELLTENPVLIQNIYAVSHMPAFEKQAVIKTSDELLNSIIDTAEHTLKLNFQNGMIWDGIKRDRLVWCGDLHPEIITSLYLWGKTSNITNSLDFLKNETPEDKWINGIPGYSAWWVINLCDYYKMTGDSTYFENNKQYAIKILEHINQYIDANGEMLFDEKVNGMSFFLDWSTFEKEGSKPGVAALLLFAAQKYASTEENTVARRIINKLEKTLSEYSDMKPVKAIQILAGRKQNDDSEFLEKNGAEGYSTFMAYYILKATAKAGGTKMLDIIKNYYGAMLDRGATSFWEDFDIKWLEGSGRIDEFTDTGLKDIHADFGKYCYTSFRHSLCHGWAAGVLAFIVEYIIGIDILDGGKTIRFDPHHCEIENISATIPLTSGELKVDIINGKATISAPSDVKII